jgi:PAS domain S-box-containing protein
MKPFDINKISLLFNSKSTEKSFTEWFFRDNLVSVRYGLILILVFNLIITGKPIFHSSEFEIVTIFRETVAALIFIHFILSFTKIYGYHFQQIITFFTLSVILFSISLSLNISSFTENTVVYIMLSALIFLLMIFTRLKFIYSTITLFIFIIFFEINAFRIYFTLSSFPLTYGNLFVLCSALFAVPAGYFFEYNQRRKFYSEIESTNKIEEMDRYLQITLKDEVKFQKILDDMPVLVIAVNNNQTIGFWNKKCEEVTGYSVGEMINNPDAVVKLFPESGYRQRVLVKFSDEKLNVANFESRMTTKNGTKRIISWSHIEKHYYLSDAPMWFSGIDITENYETWKALKKSEQRLKESQGLTHVGSWEWNVQKNKTVWSDELYRIFGYSPQSNDFDVSTIFKKIIHPEDLEYFKNQAQKAISEKHGVNFEYRICLGNGTERTISTEGDIILNEKNEVVRLFGTNRDVTEIKHTETELLKNRKILEKAQKIANIASWEFDYSKQKTVVSDEFYRIFQIKSLNLKRVQDIVYKLIVDEDKNIFRKFLTDTFGLQQNSKCEFKVRIRNGEKTVVKTISASTEIEFNKTGGKPRAVYGIFQDITQLKKALKSIENNAQKIRNILQSSPDAIFVFNEDEKITDCNYEATRIFGFSEQDIKNLHIQNLFSNDNSYPKFQKQFRKVLETKTPAKNYQLLMQTSTGEEFPAEISLAYIPAFGEETNSAVALIKNITERKQYEQKLKDARLKAEEADKLKSAFLANMSHEIRTPLNAIIGFTNLLTDPELPSDERNEYLKYIVSGSDSLLLIIEDIIDISKIESGQIQLKKTSFSLVDLIGEIYVDFNEKKIKAEKEHIELGFNVESEKSNLTIEADYERLRQILGNLLSNALKFTEKGYIEFGYDTTTQYGIKVIEFYVKDTGIGIKKEDINIIFNRFTKLENGQVGTLHRGTGLGLAISKKLITLMGGKIWVDSEPEKGSVFKFTIPLKTSEPKTTTYIENMTIQTNYLWDSKTILIAEDEMTNYKYLTAALRKTNAKVIWAQDGREAVYLCGTHPEVDLILMDIQMPVMDGYEATRKIKELRPDLPIIAQTAYTLASEKEQILKIGCNGYLPKPINRDKLITTIAKYF